MNHGGAGEVHIAMAEIQGRADLRQPSATPYPAAEDGIENRPHKDFAEQKRPKGDPLTDGAHDDVTGCLHENHFKEGQAETARVIGRTGEEKSLAAQESPLAAAQQKVIKRWDAAKVERGRVDGDRAELKCINH